MLKNGYGTIRAETADSVEYLAEIHELITINSTTDEFIRDKIIDKEVEGLAIPKSYTGTQKIDSSSFCPSPKPCSFQEKPLKNSSLRKKLCFGQKEDSTHLKSSSEDCFSKSLHLADSLLFPLALQLGEDSLKLLGETPSCPITESSD